MPAKPKYHDTCLRGSVEIQHCTRYCRLFRSTFTFTDQSVGANNWTWNYGNGTIQNSTTPINPSYTYPKSGTYSVSLAISDNVHGCKDTVVRSVVVYNYPQLSLSKNKYTCEIKPINLNAVTNINNPTYTWLPVTGLSATNIADPVATIANSQLIRLRLQILFPDVQLPTPSTLISSTDYPVANN